MVDNQRQRQALALAALVALSLEHEESGHNASGNKRIDLTAVF